MQALPVELETTAANCASIFHDLALAHPCVREAETDLESGKQVFQQATKHIHKIQKTAITQQIMDRCKELVQKSVPGVEGC